MDLALSLDEALDFGSLKSKLLTISNGWPNVKKIVTELMNDYLILTQRQPVVDIVTFI